MAQRQLTGDEIQAATAHVAKVYGALGTEATSQINSVVSNMRVAESAKIGSIKNQATQAFVGSVLKQHPEMADGLIKIRTQGNPNADLLNAALANSSLAGIDRYTFANRTLTELGTVHLTAVERSDVRDMLGAKTSVSGALTQVRKDRAEEQQRAAAAQPAVVRTPEESVTRLEEQGRANVNATATRVTEGLNKIENSMNSIRTALYDLHFTDDNVAAGKVLRSLGGATSMVGGVMAPLELPLVALPRAWGGKSAGEILEEGGKKIVIGSEAMVGAGGEEYRQAKAAAGSFMATLSECRQAAREYKQSYGDPEAFTAAAAKLETSLKKLETAARNLEAAGKAVEILAGERKESYKAAMETVVIAIAALFAAPAVEAVAHPVSHALGRGLERLAIKAAGATTERISGVVVAGGFETMAAAGEVGTERMIPKVGGAMFKVVEESTTHAAAGHVTTGHAKETITGGHEDAEGAHISESVK